uniref:GRIP and coiled-coil domain containing 2 n=1 Tax=Podarcis muralis TaxID=64176 RepID=A0A670J4E2_PODMU
LCELDTLPREDLIKFAKKQMMHVQKVKSRCSELEKEIEEMKTKPAAGGTDDILQALTERLDVVLLEKAEVQQQCLALKKENAKRQQEAEAALAKEGELQEKFAQLNTDHLKEIEGLKNETIATQSKYDETIATLQKELLAERSKQEQLTEQLNCQSNKHEEIKRLQEEVRQTKAAYEEQILNLKKQLEASIEGKKEETAKLQDVIESNSQCYQREMDRLDEELGKQRTAHQKEVSELTCQLETAVKACEEEQNKVDQLKQNLIEQYRVKEKDMQDELRACKEKYEQSGNVQLETEMAEKTRHLENALKELESQHSILQDELTYMNNVKMKLEVEIQHAQDEFFHEKEDLEFKINELQLAKEDHCGVVEKLKSELKAVTEQHEKTIKENSLETEELLEKHRREICDLKQSVSLSLERENQSLALEIVDLKEQCQKHLQEKEDAIASYESLRETMETFQTELGESAGKISREFASMKQQQASDVDELQKKLRAAFSEKDVLLETVNQLREHTEQLSSNLEELEELRHKIGTLQEENEKLVASLHQREAAVKELEEKESELSSQNDSILDKLKCSAETIESLQGKCKEEKAAAEEHQQRVEALSLCNSELEQQVEELMAKLKVEKEENQLKLGELEQQVEVLRQDKVHLSSEVASLHDENNKLKEDRDQAGKELESIASEKRGWIVSREKADNLETKLQTVCEEKDHLTKVLEEEKAFRSLVMSQLCSLLEQMGSRNPEENEGEDVAGLLQAANELFAKMKQEIQSLNSQKDENVLLQEEMQRLQEENAARCMELRSLLDDYENEKLLLREELEGAASEKEALQLDIQELKHASEKLRNENQDILVCMEDLSEKHALCENQWRSANEDLLTRVQTLQTNTKLLETQLLETQRAKAKVDKELEAEKLLKEQKIKDHTNAAKEVEELQTQLQKEKKHLQKILEELELAKKDAHKSTVMDMEMADYERCVKELNQKITDKSSRIEDLEQEIKIQKQKQETLQEEIKSFQNTVQEYEGKNTKIKQLLVKTKKELADSKQAGNELLRLQASLKGELEASQQQVEVYKIQLADITSEKHRIQEHLRTSLEQHQRVQSTYQQKLAALQEECSTAKAEYSAVTSEFESYKVRVHNVLKQKNKSSHSEADVTKQEREHMENIIDQLKIKLQDTQHNLQMNITELQSLQTEHDTLLERHNKILQETVAKEAELREKLCTIQSENMVMKSEHAQIVSQLTAQNEALRNSFRDQVRHLQEEHRKTVETLQQQLSKVEAQLFQLKSEPNTKSSAPSNLPAKNLRERRSTDLPLLDVHTITREEGEGMETTDTESVSSASTYMPSLEQLLNTPDAKFAPHWEAELTKEELVQKLNTTSKSADHLNGLLRESEATNVILMEQIKLLKSEIRRLERNQEREKSVANLEYLKNVLLQFIFLKSGSERERLLPVIDTMLQLSPEEKGRLVAIAQGEEESTSQPSGWASYLHSWSGLR